MERMPLPARYTRLRLPLVFALMAAISWVHFQLGPQRAVAHVFLQDLYFLPIFLAGFWWGPLGGLAAALAASGVYLPHVLLVLQPDSVPFVSAMTRIALFIMMGLVVGWLRRREQHHQDEAQQAESLAAVGRAVASVAHDMKTPLMAIGGFSAQVQRKLPLHSPESQKIQLVMEQTARLESMVRVMLDFSRPLELRPRPVDLASLAADCLTVAAPLAEQHGVCLCSQLEQSLPPLSADPERLQQALLNLLGNAVQASPPGGEVVLRARRNDRELRLEVADQGPGVPPEQRAQILAPFYTTKKGGTGLGLPIVKKIIEAHGGRLELAGANPNGAVFSLVLPLATGGGKA